MFWQQMVNAINLGAMYSLLAIGYTMVYGIIKLINFAHGENFIYLCIRFQVSGFGVPPSPYRLRRAYRKESR